MKEQNKVIIIGYDHINPLGLVRSFGKNRIKPYGIIVGKYAQFGFVGKSKYWKKIWYTDTPVRAIEIMKKHFSNEMKKPVVFPCADDLAMLIDQHLNELKGNFILPSINGKQGAIVELMNKFRQTRFAKDNGIKMAKSWYLNIKESCLPENLEYPCIFKPVVSAEGKKSDIEIAHDRDAALKVFDAYDKKGYKAVLVQNCLQFSHELMMAGECSDNIAYVVERKLRTWPLTIGRTSFGESVNDKKILDVCVYVLRMLQKEGYKGLVDVEFFETENGIYLNEINLRNTGLSALAMASGVHYAVEWYYQMIGMKKMDLKTSSDEVWYYMNEVDDFNYVKKKIIGYFEWKGNKEKVSAFTYYDKEDILPCIAFLFIRIRSKVLKTIKKLCC